MIAVSQGLKVFWPNYISLWFGKLNKWVVVHHVVVSAGGDETKGHHCQCTVQAQTQTVKCEVIVVIRRKRLLIIIYK